MTILQFLAALKTLHPFTLTARELLSMTSLLSTGSLILTSEPEIDRMIRRTMIVLTILIGGTSCLVQCYAATFEMHLTADNSSRWFDLWAGAFTELGSIWEVRDGTTGEVISVQSPTRDGAFALSGEGINDIASFDPFTFSPTVYEELGTSAEGFGDAFINENNFSNNYSIEYDEQGLIGTGIETASVTGLSLDFDQDVADNDTIFGVGYETLVSNLAGTVTLVDGAVGAIDLSALVTLEYDTSSSPTANVGILSFEGNFQVSGSSWELMVDDADGDIFGVPYRLAWDLHGMIANLATSPIADADFDDSGNVDGQDFLLWQRNSGISNASHDEGDSNNDQLVDATDLANWRSQYGEELSTLTTSIIPEPATFALSHLLVFSGLTFRWRRN